MKFLMRIVIIILFFAFFEGVMAQEDVLTPNSSSDNAIHKKSSKTSWKIGIEAGLNYNMLSQDFNWNKTYRVDGVNYNLPPHGTIFNDLSKANGSSPHFGVLVDYSISEMFGLQLRLSYDVKNVSVSTSGNDIDNVNLIQHPMNLDVDTKLAYLTINPLLRINATKNLFFTVGPVFHFLSGDIETTWKPNSLDGTALEYFTYWNYLCTLANNLPISKLPSGTIKFNEANTVSTRIGLECGIGYKFQITDKIEIAPQIRYQLLFSKIVDDKTIAYKDPIYHNEHPYEATTDKKINTLQFTIALWYGF